MSTQSHDEEELIETKDEYNTSITLTDPLIEPFFIIKDRHGYVLNMKTKTNPNYTVDGSSKEIIKFMGHYAHITDCLNKIATHGVHMKKNYTSIKEYINEFNSIKEKSNKFLKSIIDD